MLTTSNFTVFRVGNAWHEFYLVEICYLKYVAPAKSYDESNI